MHHKTLKLTLLAAAITSSMGLHAQSIDNSNVERIQVTGSHIKRTDLEGPNPIQIISQEDIENTGFDNLQQILERLPIAGSGTFSTRGNSQDSTANGGAALSLRGFGADATLVLVNGRRVAISSFAEGIVNSFVDINSIPVAAIERIDILKDGASAIYGSDAVAGVINIILRKDFVGKELSLGHGSTTGPGYDETTFSAVWGVGSDKDNATLIVDYFTNSAISNSELGRFGTANQEPYGGQDFRSSRGFPGRFIVDGVTTIDPDCPADRAFGATCVFDYGPFGVAVPAAERLGAILQLNSQLSDKVDLFTELALQHNTSEAGGAPTPLDEDAQLTVPASHPNNPFLKDIDIGRFRTVDAGARRWDIESDTLRLVVGLRGELAGWEWEVAAQKGRSESTQTGGRDQGWVRTDFLQQEINAGRYNPFGGVNNPAEVIDAITTSLVRSGESHLTSYDANITGDLYQMEHGTLAIAAGIEYREEDVLDRPDDQFQRGLIFGTESVSAQAARDQWAAFVELSVPVIEHLELQLALRYDDYSDFGNTTNPKVAMLWTPSETLSLRASWSEGFRAPSLAQVGLGPSQESQFFTDTFLCPTPDEDNPACAATDYTIVFAGNPDLKAEESETWNAGAVWVLTDGLDVGIDVWGITQDNKIDEVPFGQVYQLECGNQNSTVCIRRTPLAGQTLGPLSQINNTFFNVSSQKARGVDLSAHYAFDVADMGSFKWSLDWTYMSKFEKDGLELTGEYEYPQHRWVSSIDWSMAQWGITTSFVYIGEFEDTPDIDFDGVLDFEQNTSRTVAHQLTIDLQGRVDVNENLRLILGMQNALDEDPSFAIGDGDGDLYGYATNVHNPRGQYIYGKISYRF